jgi:hypothetical protein
VRVIKREKRGSHCLEEQGVATAPVPAQIVPKSKLSNEFIIEVLARKYQQHLPIYRQCATLAEDHGIELSRKTLTDALLTAGGLLRAVVLAQAKDLISERQWHPSQVLKKRRDGRVESSMETTGRKELVRWVLSWMPDVRVLAPKSLRDKIALKLEEGLQRSGENEGMPNQRLHANREQARGR